MSATPTRQKKTLWLYGIIALLLIITVGTLISAQKHQNHRPKRRGSGTPGPLHHHRHGHPRKTAHHCAPDLHRELRHLNPATLQR